MSIPEGPVDHSIDSRCRPNQTLRHRWRTLGFTAVTLVVLGILILLEGSGFVGRRQSVERIKAWARTLPTDSTVTLKDFESQLSGSPQRMAFNRDGSTRVIYTWPSVISKYRLRALLGQNGKIIYLDTEPNEAEDFVSPFLVANDDGVRIVVPGQPPPSHTPPESNVDLLELTRIQFAQPKALRLPDLVVFPVIDDRRAITPSGPALSLTAQYSLAFTPHRRMSLSPRLVQQALTDGACWSPGTILNQPSIERCLQALGAERFALPRVQERDGKWQIQIDVYHRGSEDRVTINRHADTVNLIPGEIALGVFEHLKAVLSPAEIATVTAPQFQQLTDAEEFTRRVTGTQMTVDEFRAFHKQLLERNQQWLAAWRYYLEQATPLNASPREFPPSVIREHPAIGRGQNINTFSKIDCVKLLKLASSFRGDPDFHEVLFQMAHNFRDEQLAKELLRIWKIEDNSYTSRVARARGLVAAGWAILSPRDATQPTPANRQAARELFEQAEAELEQALVLNPQGSEAHTEMIEVAQGLNRPWPQIQAHLENAVREQPGNEKAWYYVQRGTGRTGPKNAAHAYQFAEFCLANGKWRDVPDILRGAAYDPEKRTLVQEQFQAPEHWQLIKQYFHQAQQQPLDTFQLRLAQASFAHDAAMTGHYAEAAPVFDQLDLPFQPPPLPPNAPPGTPVARDPIVYPFRGQARYIQLRDMVRAKLFIKSPKGGAKPD